MRGHVAQVLQPFLFASTQARHGCRDPNRPGQAANDVQVDPDEILGIHIIRI